MAYQHHEPAANTNAVATFAAAPSVAHEIVSIQCSYNATPTGGAVQVESPSGTVIWKMFLPAAGAFSFTFNTRSLKGAEGAAMIVTVAAGGASATGTVAALTRS